MKKDDSDNPLKGRSIHRGDVPLSTKSKSLLSGNAYCGCCGAHLSIMTCGNKYQKKDGSVSRRIYYRYKCGKQTSFPVRCNGQSSFSVEKVDNLVDQIVRIQLAQIQKAPPKELLKKRRDQESRHAKNKVKLLQDQYQQKEKEYQAYRCSCPR